ncbi:type IV secretory system conjugative DNA transfer family protein [Rhodopirellula europaea]|uniref:Uncharacterized protein n=1 Tax=Rhodopirellula europaea 6C TaxID=1263867 RepID=M2ACY4_9BACT|nr:hypothetical protein [Rhodopirellula europaea]EMB14850.1 hypothetical protein RE6C_04418 [Rhodopirellula europaea 6C]
MFWRKKDPPLFSIEQAVTGILATGRPGSGKTTLVNRIAIELAAMGCIVCVCCIKPDEADNYSELLKRYKPLRIEPGNAVINPLTYELGRKGGSPRSLARFMEDLTEVLSRSSSEKTEVFWKSGTADTQAYAIELAYMVKGKDASFQDVYDIILSAPSDPAQASSESLRSTPLGQLLERAFTINPERAKVIADFFLKRFACVGEKANGAFRTGALTAIAPFLEPGIKEITSGRSTITPEQMLERHTILALDTLTYSTGGLALNLLASWLCMEAVLRRTKWRRPFVLVRDEYHQLAHAERDIRVQSVGRSQEFIGISAVQTLPVLKAAMGGDLAAQNQSEALYGLHVSKVMCNNNCHLTNEFNSNVIGQERVMFYGGGVASQDEPPEWYDFFGVGKSPNVSFNQQWHFKVPPASFLSLRTGGPANRGYVDAIIHRGTDGHEFVTHRQEKKP